MTFSHQSPAPLVSTLKTMDTDQLQVHDENILTYYGHSIKVTALPLIGVIIAITLVLHVQIDSPYTIDCVLMDLRLGNGDDGFDTIKLLRRIDEDVPVIIMSGDTAPNRMQQANAIGCSWLVKPVKPDDLIAALSRAIQHE